MPGSLENKNMRQSFRREAETSGQEGHYMEYRKFGNHYVVRIEKGEEVLEQLTQLCRQEQIRVGTITGLGAANRVVVGSFDTTEKVYHKTELKGVMEITSLVGNISTKDGEPYLHVHINVCDEQMQVHGGHLNECWISATGEVTVTKIEGVVEREMSEDVGLNLYRFE